MGFSRYRANIVHMGQSRPDSGFGFQLKVICTFPRCSRAGLVIGNLCVLAVLDASGTTLYLDRGCFHFLLFAALLAFRLQGGLRLGFGIQSLRQEYEDLVTCREKWHGRLEPRNL